MKTFALVALDVDGVLTDGTVELGEGRTGKRIAFHDLDAVTALRRAGLEVALVTGEDDTSVDLLAQRFGISLVRRGAKDKVQAIREMAGEMGITMEQVCYLGDSDRDAPALQAVGLGLAPANATPAARAAAHRVLGAKGGQGAVAEAARVVLSMYGWAAPNETRHQDLVRIIAESRQTLARMGEQEIRVLDRVAVELAQALAGGRKILLFGNGGSAADAQHVAGELVGRFAQESDPWPAIALTTDSSILTCVGNDWSFAEVFRRQVRALAKPGDVVVGISTSGRSPNVLNGMAEGKKRGAVAIGFTGAAPGPLGEVADICFCAPAVATPRIQELHLVAWHAVCEVVEGMLMGPLRSPTTP